MVGEIVDTLKDLAGRWLARSARIPKEHPFEAPTPHVHLEPESPSAAWPSTGIGGSGGGAVEAAPLQPSAPVAAQAPSEAPPVVPSAGAPESPAAPSRAWSADMRQVTPAPEGEVGEKIVNVLRTCYDPEIPVNIYELGLIYGIELDEAQNAWVVMTLTSPMCPVAGSLPPEVESKVASVEGVASAKVDVVWDPPWNPDMMTEAAKLDLGML